MIYRRSTDSRPCVPPCPGPCERSRRRARECPPPTTCMTRRRSHHIYYITLHYMTSAPATCMTKASIHVSRSTAYMPTCVSITSTYCDGRHVASRGVTNRGRARRRAQPSPPQRTVRVANSVTVSAEVWRRLLSERFRRKGGGRTEEEDRRPTEFDRGSPPSIKSRCLALYYIALRYMTLQGQGYLGEVAELGLVRGLNVGDPERAWRVRRHTRALFQRLSSVIMTRGGGGGRSHASVSRRCHISACRGRRGVGHISACRSAAATCADAPQHALTCAATGAHMTDPPPRPIRGAGM